MTFGLRSALGPPHDNFNQVYAFMYSSFMRVRLASYATMSEELCSLNCHNNVLKNIISVICTYVQDSF